MSNIYDEAIADAKKIRETAREEARRMLEAKFAPKIERYIEQALMEDSTVNEAKKKQKKPVKEDDEDLLTDDMTDDESDEMLQYDTSDEEGDEVEIDDSESVVSDIQMSLKGVGSDGSDVDLASAISLDPNDGKIVLDLSKLKVDDVSTDVTDVEAAGTESGSLVDARKREVKESIDKLQSVIQLIEGIDDKTAAYLKLVTAFRRVTESLSASPAQDGTYVVGLSKLANHINEAYVKVRETSTIEKPIRESICNKFEKNYADVTTLLGEAVCHNISSKLNKLERKVLARRSLREARHIRIYNNRLNSELDGLKTILEAVIGKARPSTTEKLKRRIVTLHKEINTMSNRGRRLREEKELNLKLTFDDDAAAEKLKSALGGMSDEDEDDMDDMGGMDDMKMGPEEDEGEEDEGEENVKESRLARSMRRLFEADEEEDEGDEDEGDEDEEDEDEGEEDEGGDSTISALMDALEAGDVKIELVDDMGGMDDMKMGPEEDEGEEDEGDEFGEPEVKEGLDEMSYGEADTNESDCGPMEGQALYDVQEESLRREIMRRKRLRETGYHTHKQSGPGRYADFGGGRDEGHLFEVEVEEVEEGEEPSKKRQGKVKESYTTRPVRRGGMQETLDRSIGTNVARLQRELHETKKKQADSNLLAAKLLYTNRILTMEGLTTAQRERITDAIDEARSLKEAQLLYRNITQSLTKRKSTLSEGRHRPIGASSTLRSGGPTLRESSTGNDSSLLNENIDLDMWRKHAGLD